MRLIDADALEVSMADDWHTANEIANYIKYAPTVFELPDNATNGDMIKAMFPNAIYQEGFLYQIVNGKQYVFLSVAEYWWNAPYERR